MPNKYPFAVRLIGFDDTEADRLQTAFSAGQERSVGYFRLLDDNLQDPDLFLANADYARALARLAYYNPSEVRPALLIGEPAVDLPYPCIRRPILWPNLFAALDAMIEQRADALARLEASDIINVPERRRYERLDTDLRDPADYIKMRRTPVDGGVLVIDKAAMLRGYLAGVLGKQGLTVGLVNNAPDAIAYCDENQVSVVLMNTSTPGIDPYALCERIKRSKATQHTSVIMLTGKPFVYDQVRARCAGCDGFLNKPLAPHHLLSALRKFLPASRLRPKNELLFAQ